MMNKLLKKSLPCIKTIISLVIFIFIGQIMFIYLTRHLQIHNLVDVRKPILIVFSTLYCIGVVVYTMILHRFLDKKSWKEFGFGFRKKEILVTIISIIMSGLFFFMMILLTRKWGITIWRWTHVEFKYVLNVVFIYLLVGLNEESYFRGYLYKSLTHYGKIPAYVVSGLIFVLIHFMQQTFSVFYLIELLIATFSLIYIYDVTGSIWPGVLIHGAYDIFLALFQGNRTQASLIIWIGNKGPLSIGDLLMCTAIASELIIILLFYFVYKRKWKLTTLNTKTKMRGGA